MAYEQKDNSASIFENDKQGNESRPDLRGRGLVNGFPVWVSGWKKKDKNGKTWVSLSFQKREEQGGDQSQPTTPHKSDLPEGW